MRQIYITKEGQLHVSTCESHSATPLTISLMKEEYKEFVDKCLHQAEAEIHEATRFRKYLIDLQVSSYTIEEREKQFSNLCKDAKNLTLEYNGDGTFRLEALPLSKISVSTVTEAINYIISANSGKLMNYRADYIIRQLCSSLGVHDVNKIFGSKYDLLLRLLVITKPLGTRYDIQRSGNSYKLSWEPKL